MAKRQLKTFDEVVKALGGVERVCIITEASQQSFCNWRTRGFFPAVEADRIRHHLMLGGHLAHPELFRMKKAVA